MTDRDTLVKNYLARQTDLASMKERHIRTTNERDDKKSLLERTEVQLKNLECIAHRVGEVH